MALFASRPAGKDTIVREDVRDYDIESSKAQWGHPACYQLGIAWIPPHDAEEYIWLYRAASRI